jgi:hypothetical protein
MYVCMDGWVVGRKKVRGDGGGECMDGWMGGRKEARGDGGESFSSFSSASVQ